MADSPEHKFISESLGRALEKYSETRLLGLKEVDRRMFDYGCLLLRDASRPLVSQVLWSHDEGIEKDVLSLLFDAEASLKVYFVRDRIRNRARIDGVLRAYRQNPATRPLLRGLRVIPIPEDFDADSPDDREWMDRYILDHASSDLLFGVVFGKLTEGVFATRRAGRVKLAALQVIAKSGRTHGPSFEKEIGYRGSPLREVITMLTGVGFIGAPGFSIIRVPTLKGRFLLDFARRPAFEWYTSKQWSSELQLVMRHLQIEPRDVWNVDLREIWHSNPIADLLLTAENAHSQFGIDIMSEVDFDNPIFYSDLPVEFFTSGSFYGVTPDLWADGDDIFDLRIKSSHL